MGLHIATGINMDCATVGHSLDSGLASRSNLIELPSTPKSVALCSQKKKKEWTKPKKKTKWLLVGKKIGPKSIRIPRVVHDLVEVCAKLFDVVDNHNTTRANSSSIFLAGIVLLCADSISNSDIVKCNNKF